MPLFVTLNGERARPFRVILSGAAAQLPFRVILSGAAAQLPLPCHPERSEAESTALYDNNDDIHIEIPRKARDDKGRQSFVSP